MTASGALHSMPGVATHSRAKELSVEASGIAVFHTGSVAEMDNPRAPRLDCSTTDRRPIKREHYSGTCTSCVADDCISLAKCVEGV